MSHLRKNNHSLQIGIALLLLLMNFSCGKIENSSSQDRSLYSPTPEGTPQFDAASTVLSAKCSECHGSWAGFSEADFIASGLVVAQSPENSKVYYRNQDATSGVGPKNMPTQGRSALTTAELQVVTDWINSITP